ncbi:hypothetical protein LHJ74_12885 [Streptomyces sp. N2-109]|uniref:Uncharacterized protein n=1 Tax=Streptomyces gossypii TaxID=2883101 RepID=A0ABT2JSC9_9ACTN|nr:hypothetical protein [Streptomyces gossypii]MCT2590796.1 hypothetical protein [Streptomyces gossypii]
MLCVNQYSREYITECRMAVDEDIASYRELATAVGGTSGKGKAQAAAALEAFEPVFFNNMVLAMDRYFEHRSRTLELKDGNALNEVRVLCTSLAANNGRLAADKQIKLKPERSVLGYAVGDEVRLSADDFERLAKAFFAEMESKFS